ncbi:hypothetical protein WMY93_021825 [Mugilogobius chulae]|uniref:ATP-dependent RNA helicase DHX29-like UBA domain-containing protein n=1 Tax=Mugilogobius chulae TaxID=88201 RepID=A0AAW0NEY6_9GOBI
MREIGSGWAERRRNQRQQLLQEPRRAPRGPPQQQHPGQVLVLRQGTGQRNRRAKHPTNPANKPQDNKSKVPKNYSLANVAQVDTGSSDKSVLKVAIQGDLEKKIIRLINDFRQEYADKGPVSGRLTSKKLLDLYVALEKFHFKREHIEEAMKSRCSMEGIFTLHSTGSVST